MESETQGQAARLQVELLPALSGRSGNMGFARPNTVHSWRKPVAPWDPEKEDSMASLSQQGKLRPRAVRIGSLVQD